MSKDRKNIEAKPDDTVFRRRVKQRALEMECTEEEAEELLLQATAASLAGANSPRNKAAPQDASQIASFEDAINFFNKDHFTDYINGKYKVVRENPDGTIEIMETKDFVKGFPEIKLLIVPGDGEGGKPKLTPVTELWLNSGNRRRFMYGFDFDPSFVGNRNGKYNLFKGLKLGAGKAGDVAPFRNFVKEVICSGNEENFNYLEALIADMFQGPHLKPGIVVVIRGDEGVGKSFFVERLSDLIAPYYFRTSNPEHIFGDHNGQLKDKILLHLEEAVWPGGKKTESLLKDMITNPTIPINDKFVPAYSVPNHLHLFITGNPDWLIAAGPKARRVFALHASEAHIKDTQYFGDLDKWFKDGGDAALLHYYLNHKSDINLRLSPITNEHIEQQKQSMSGAKEWANNWVELGEWPYGEVRNGHCYVIKSLLCHDYNNSPSGKRHPLTDRQFGGQFLGLFPVVDAKGKKEYVDNGKVKSVIIVSGPGHSIQERNCKGKQADAYDIPPIAELRQVVDFNFGGKNDWDLKEEWTIRHGDNKVDLESRTVVHVQRNVDPNSTDPI